MKYSSILPLLAVAAIFLPATVVAGSSLGTFECSRSKLNKVKGSYQTCVRQKQEYFRSKALSSVSGVQTCEIIDEVFVKCGELFDECLNEKEQRKLLDAQLQVYLELMEEIYDQGDEVRKCPIFQEYEQSGRKDMVGATEKCTSDQVSELTEKYSLCAERGSEDLARRLSRARVVNRQDEFTFICEAVEKVIHGCGDLLKACFPEDQISDSKFTQLDLLREVVLQLTKYSYNQIDLGKCPIYNSASKLATPSLLGFQIFFSIFLSFFFKSF